MCQQNVLAFILTELSKHFAVHLPEQQDVITYQIKQEKFCKRLKREDRRMCCSAKMHNGRSNEVRCTSCPGHICVHTNAIASGM